MSGRTVEQIIKEHKASGKMITVEGVRTFALDWGKGEPVFCIYGVPTSSYLYRKVLKGLEEKGYRGIAIDLPGLGLSDRPEDFDYSFSDYARFCARAAEALGLERYHLVVHDVGGPIGFALAAQNREEILSLTILNTWIDVDKFKKPLPMRPYEKPVLGEAQLATTTHATWQLMFKELGVANMDDIPKEEIDSYVDLLKREDEGEAFLKIMRNFEDSVAFRELCHQAVQDVPYPVQAIWGAEDPGLSMSGMEKRSKRSPICRKCISCRQSIFYRKINGRRLWNISCRRRPWQSNLKSNSNCQRLLMQWP